MPSYSIGDLYAITWPYIGLPYGGTRTPASIKKTDAYDILDNGGAIPERTGLLGTPIFLPCRINGYDLPNEPLIDVVGEKMIVKTEVDGNNGTFKELYSVGDYQVTIRGIAINEDDPDSYPEDIMRQIRQVIEEPQHVAIVNKLTGLFSIEFVAIEGYSFPAVPGELGAQGYELRCISDKEFPLRLRNR